MRAFAGFVGVLVAAGLVAALLAYPVYELTSQIASWPFHRVAGRIAMLAAAGGLIWLCRRLDVAGKPALGYGLPWRRFVIIAVSFGLVGMATAAAAAWLELAREWRTPVPGSLLEFFLVGLSSGIAVALIEETVMRGAMHTAIARESGQWVAVLLTAPLFAVLHFFAKAHIPPEQLYWGSGFDLLTRSFAPLGAPSLVFDSFAAWLAVSLVLSLSRVLTGNIAAAVGLHAGWVVVLRMLQEGSVAGPSAAASPWVGRFDGLLGYWVLPWSAAIGLGLWITRARWGPYCAVGATDARRSSRSSGSSISR